jgi:hypothetical protein
LDEEEREYQETISRVADRVSAGESVSYKELPAYLWDDPETSVFLSQITQLPRITIVLCPGWDRDLVALLWGRVEDSRFEELQEGAEPTREELALFEERFVEDRMDNLSGDGCAALDVYEIDATGGRSIYIAKLITGSAMDELYEEWLDPVFSDSEVIDSHVRELGYRF